MKLSFQNHFLLKDRDVQTSCYQLIGNLTEQGRKWGEVEALGASSVLTETLVLPVRLSPNLSSSEKPSWITLSFNPPIHWFSKCLLSTD